MDWVFGYGSLAAITAPGQRTATLHGHRRRWGVAMDNREAIRGYKRYVDEQGGHPAVHVAFLDLAPVADGAVNGVCQPVGSAQLAALDARERNYERRDVTAWVERLGDAGAGGRPARVWAYLGSAAGRERLADGLREGRAVVSREYLDLVLRGFALRGSGELARFHASSDLQGLPVRGLRRIDLDELGSQTT